MKPVINESLYEEFINTNGWTQKYYSHQVTDKLNLVASRTGMLKKFSEWMLGGKLGEWLDIWSMKRTLQFWKKKFPEMKSQEFEINFKSDRTISKHHPNGFQKRVLDELELKMREFEQVTSISLR